MWLAAAGVLCSQCEEEVDWSGGGERALPVLHSILRADDDTVRVRVTWTKEVGDRRPVRGEDGASVWLYADGVAVGEGVSRGDGWYVVAHRVRPSTTYRVAAWVPGEEAVWGETRVPSAFREASITYDTARGQVVNRWLDNPEEKNYYWLTHVSGSVVGDTARPTRFLLQSYMRTSSTLADPFNRTFDYEEEIPAEYDYYVRVEDAGLAGERLELAYNGGRSWFMSAGDDSTRDAHYVEMHLILSLDEHYDHYLRSAITNQEYAYDLEDFPLFVTPLWYYSNVTGGVGLVASYVRFAHVEERVFRKYKEDPFDDIFH